MYSGQRGDVMEISFAVEKITFNRVLFNYKDHYFEEEDSPARQGDHMPYYEVMLKGTFKYQGQLITKMYRCSLFSYPLRTTYLSYFYYKNWVIERPYLYIPEKKESRNFKQKIRKVLFKFLDNLEKETIRTLEEKRIPIVSKVHFSTHSLHEFKLIFYLKNYPGTFLTVLYFEDPPKAWDSSVIIKQFTRKNLIFSSIPKSLYWEDHIFEQLVEILRTKSKYRTRYILHVDKLYRYSTFQPSVYPIDKVKIFYSK